MYILIRIGTNDTRLPWKVSKFKNKLEKYVKDKGCYFNKGMNRYIDDKNSGIDGGSGVDYIINQIEELT